MSQLTGTQLAIELRKLNPTLPIVIASGYGGAGFETRDAESLREHYAMTLRHWVRRLMAHADRAEEVTDARTVRIWRLYMSASAHGFATGRLNVVQTLLAKPADGRSGLPLTRADILA